MGVYEHEALECQNIVTSFSFLPQGMWPNKRGSRDQQNYHCTQIPSYGLP